MGKLQREVLAASLRIWMSCEERSYGGSYIFRILIEAQAPIESAEALPKTPLLQAD